MLLVLVGGAVGAPLRYLLDLFVQSRHASVFPWGTFTVNVVGSVVLGLVAGAASAADGPRWLVTLVGTGVCGAFTTYSTFGFETVRLTQEGYQRAAVANVAGSVAVGVAGAALGWWLGSVVG